ncbi:MAG: F-type H+-transporting ATPase subunit delta [Planctomycetota bacterium]|jgi:F-type H+-transporting ATPase subunit delta
MANQRLSSRYANSILQLAKEGNILTDVFSDMQLIKKTITDSKDLKLMLNSPIVSAKDKTVVLTKVFGGNVKDLTTKFLSLLISKGREGFLLEISNEFIAEYNSIHKIADITLLTAIPATVKIVEEVTSLLTKSGTYSKVSIKQEVDPKIIGGFVLKMDDQLLDNSIQRKLQVIKKGLQK